MGIVFDVATYSNVQTYAHTVAAGANFLCVDVMMLRNGWDTVVTGITYGGNAMTPKGTAMNNTAGWRLRTTSYYLVSPPIGANNVVVTLDDTVNFFRSVASSRFGVDVSAPVGAGVGQASGNSAGPATVNVASATGELVVDAVCTGANPGTVTVGALQTQRHNTGSQTVPVGTSDEPGQATVTMSWTLSFGTQWAIVAYALLPQLGAGGPRWFF